MKIVAILTTVPYCHIVHRGSISSVTFYWDISLIIRYRGQSLSVYLKTELFHIIAIYTDALKIILNVCLEPCGSPNILWEHLWSSAIEKYIETLYRKIFDLATIDRFHSYISFLLESYYIRQFQNSGPLKPICISCSPYGISILFQYFSKLTVMTCQHPQLLY